MGGGIEFYINGFKAYAEEGMTFREWIFSDYFDVTNPYNIAAPNLSPNITDTREFLIQYGDTELNSPAGLRFTPPIISSDVIIPNCMYSVRTGDWG